ncbi:MAG: hypothetical protein ACK5N0_05215 [Synechococcaceae cyanobacterium]
MQSLALGFGGMDVEIYMGWALFGEMVVYAGSLPGLFSLHKAGKAGPFYCLVVS